MAEKNPAMNYLKKIKNSSSSTVSLIIAYIIICIVFALSSPYFLKVNNLLNMATYASITGVMGAGVTVAMLMGNIDMSQYSIATLSAIVAAYMMRNGAPVLVAILLGILVGVVCGIINGSLISLLKMSGIIATMGTMQIFRGLAYILTNGETVMIENDGFDIIGKKYLFGTIPVAVIIMIVSFLLIYFILRRTTFGRNIYAVGGSEKASYLAGINIKLIKFGSMVISAVFAAISGLILSSQVGAAVPSTGVGSEMGVLSAVILGGISLSGGRGRISGTIIGILILETIQNGMTLLSIKSFYQMIINGAVLIAAVTLDVIRSGALKKQ